MLEKYLHFIRARSAQKTLYAFNGLSSAANRIQRLEWKKVIFSQ